MEKTKTGIELIAKDRQDQIEKHGYDKQFVEDHPEYYATGEQVSIPNNEVYLHEPSVIEAMQAYSSQQNTALMEENKRLREVLNAFVDSCYTGISKDGLDQLRINSEKVLKP